MFDVREEMGGLAHVDGLCSKDSDIIMQVQKTHLKIKNSRGGHGGSSCARLAAHPKHSSISGNEVQHRSRASF